MAKYGPSQERRVEKKHCFSRPPLRPPRRAAGTLKANKSEGMCPCTRLCLGVAWGASMFWFCHNEREDLPTPALSLHRPRTQASESKAMRRTNASRTTKRMQPRLGLVGGFIGGRPPFFFGFHGALVCRALVVWGLRWHQARTGTQGSHGRSNTAADDAERSEERG